MKANKNSLHAKLYRFTYSECLPINLCPYFWKLVFGVLVFIPNLIIQFPSMVIDLFVKSDDRDKIYDAGPRRVCGAIIYACIGGLFGLGVVNYHLFAALLHCYSFNHDAATIACLVDFIISFVVSYILIFNYLEQKKMKKHSDEITDPKPNNIITEFIKAKYHKYCPKIDWE